MTGPGARPGEILAIDWGATPAKRQLCRAVLRRGSYVVAPPRPVEDVGALELAPDALVAFDCPIGLPDVYAAKAGLPSFRAALRTFGAGRFDRFYDFAGAPAEIAIERPFYPRRGIKGTTRDHLRAALGDAAFTPRACDRQAGAGPIFWLVGPRQVGRSAACVWREILTPRLDRLALWVKALSLAGAAVLARRRRESRGALAPDRPVANQQGPEGHHAL